MKLNVENLSVNIDKKTIIQNVSFVADNGKFVGLIGANGSGKSTLLKSIYKSLEPSAGMIYLDDLDVLKSPKKKIAKNLSVVSQHNELMFDMTVYQMVLLGRTPHKKIMETDSRKDYEIVDKALQATSLWDYKDRNFFSLSGGEKQRVVLARALAQEPKYIILDEPTNHLDIRYQLEILEIVKNLNISVLAALHDLDLTANYCDYLYAMKDGEIIGEGTPEELLTNQMVETIFGVKCQTFTHPITKRISFSYYL